MIFKADSAASGCCGATRCTARPSLTLPREDFRPFADIRGAATFRYLGVALYDASLFTPGGGALNWTRDFGLELRYKRTLSQKSLVDATLREMERLGADVPGRGKLERCFDDVGRGDSYLAVSQGPNAIGFWRNGRQVCTLSHPGIKRSFMSIFLGENTQSAAFTRQLLGL